MQGNDSKTSRAFRARGLAAVCAALILAGGSAFAAPTETVLYSFSGGSDGAFPAAGLIFDSSGNLNGTTEIGGASGAGTVFKVPATGGSETVLYPFCSSGPNCADGELPAAGLIADSAGNFYGTTSEGALAGSGCVDAGCGVVFKLAPGGTETVLYSFTGGSDGANPGAPEGALTPGGDLYRDSNGNLYGTTSRGGVSGAGTVFKLTPGGTETVLHSFTGFSGGSDGGFPLARLIADSSGNLYGTTESGGASGNGVVFKVSPDGTNYRVLYSFCSKPSCSDGANPIAGLIADSSGNLYGTTESGGASGNGVAFKVSPDGTNYTVLYSFCSKPSCSDGAFPIAGLIADSSGNLHGTTAGGGASGMGTVFKLTPGGTETVLYSFTGGSDGAVPFAGLIADSSGNLYGTTVVGGSGTACPAIPTLNPGCGVVFKLAGTGFATAVPFAAFSGKLEIAFGSSPNTDSFELKASFALGSASKGFNLATDPVTLSVGRTFTTTIPAGSFKGSGAGPFTFEGVINGVSLQVRIALTNTGARQYSLQAEAKNASLTGTTNQVPLTLTIGNNTGTTMIHAEID